MGAAVGVLSKGQLKGLSKKDKAQLKEHVVHFIETSPEIRKIIDKNPKLVTKNPRIRAILRREAGPMLEQLKRK